MYFLNIRHALCGLAVILLAGCGSSASEEAIDWGYMDYAGTICTGDVAASAGCSAEGNEDAARRARSKR